jgi:hypothetical protein
MALDIDGRRLDVAFLVEAQAESSCCWQRFVEKLHGLGFSSMPLARRAFWLGCRLR